MMKRMKIKTDRPCRWDGKTCRKEDFMKFNDENLSKFMDKKQAEEFKKAMEKMLEALKK